MAEQTNNGRPPIRRVPQQGMMPQGPQAELQQRAMMEMELLEKNKLAKEMQAMQPKKITEVEIRKASDILKKYKDGKKMLEEKIIANEEFWKLRQWNYINDKAKDFKPATAWLWSCIQSRYSDVMDSYPTCNIQPRQMDDKSEAKMLSSIIPVVMEQNKYEETYSDVAWYMLKHGGCVQGIFWDGSKHNGLGDISIKKIDFINLFWEPGITDIQDSPHFFSVNLVNSELLDEQYPEYAGKFNKGAVDIAQYNYDDSVDTSKKAMVIDWYYKKNVNGRLTVQYVKYCGNVVLYATENDTEAVTDELGNVIRPPMAQTGLYVDGKYPFVFDVLFEIEGTPTGHGYTDNGKDCQIQIDMLNNAITKNAMLACKPRWFAREDAAINIGDFLDWSKDVIRVASGDLSDVALRQVDIAPLGGQYVDVLNNRINELKETLGHRDVNTGGTVAGVTSASGIIALQESSGKIDKATALETYDAQEQIAQMVISRIKQFFTTPRVFRMLDDNGDVKYVEYISKRDADGFPEMPFFDIDITAEQASPYKAISQNELMLQLYQQGFFLPDNAMNALACLDGMDFDGKEDVMATIQQNNTIMQQFVKLAALVDQAYGTNMSMMIGGQAPAPQGSGEEVSLNAESNGHIRKARERAEEANAPV